MVNAAIQNELTVYLGRLPVEQQRQVLEYARTLASEPLRGVSGSALLPFAGVISTTELDAMSAAIEQGCERIDADEW